MAGINKVIIVGNLGADPEVKYTATGTAVAKLRIATSESWTNKEGTRDTRTEWHRVVAWSKLAELCNEYLKKGRQVYIEGKLQTNQWQDKDGNTRYTTEIIANTIQFLGSKQDSTSSSQSAENPPSFGSEDEPSTPSDPNSDIPF